jgi:ATP-binding cassette, subfamily B, bacterial
MTQKNTQEINPEAKKSFSFSKLKRALSIFTFILPYKWQMIGGLALLFLSSMVFMVFPYLSGLMIDVAQGKGKYDLTLANIGWILAVILLIQGFFSYSRVMLFARVSESGIADVRRAVYQKIICLPIFFFEQNRVGDLVSRVTADVEKLYSAFSVTLAEFVRQVIILIAGILFLAFTTPKLALIMLLSFPVIVVGAMFFGRIIRKLSKKRQEELATSNTILNETFQTIQVVKAFSNELFESFRYQKSIDEVVRVSMKYASGRALFAVFIITLLFGALFFVIWEGATMVQKGEISAGQLVAFVTYTAIIGGAIAGLGNFYTELLGAVGATERLREILEMENEVKIMDTEKTQKIDLKGDFRFSDVRFSYPSRPDVSVLNGINLHIPAGKKIALVGASGAGKSTIAQLIFQFYKVTSGSIEVDGKDIYAIDLQAYRKNLAIVPQEVMLFGGSIRENIQYGNPHASEEQIRLAAAQANALEFVDAFPEGMDTIVGERGVKLSGGQRQRIAIARAILRNPTLLVLDEATSSLDSQSEKDVQDALHNLMQNRTSIIIAHRLSTIRDVDCIYVLDKGKIAETGTHHELMSHAGGIYRRLVELQDDGADPSE